MLVEECRPISTEGEIKEFLGGRWDWNGEYM